MLKVNNLLHLPPYFYNFEGEKRQKMFKKGKSKLSSRITWRVILIMLLFNVFIIGAVWLLDFGASKNMSGSRAQLLIDKLDGRLMTVLRAVEITATNNVAEIEDNLDSPETVYAAMEHELRLNPNYLGYGVGFIADYYSSQGHWFEPYVRNADSLRIEREQIGSAEHDYFQQDWYLKGFALKRGEGYVTDPYFDNDGAKCIMCSYVTPIFDRQGRKVGVYGADMNLDWIKTMIAYEEQKVKKLENVEDKPDEDNYFFIQILDSKGKKIAGSEDFDEETLQVILKEDSIAFREMMVNGVSYYITSKRLDRTGWTLVVAQNYFLVMLYGYVLASILLFLMVVGCLALFYFTSHGIRRAMKPLRILSDSSREVAQGNFDTLLPTFKHQDEITQMRDSFCTMQQSLKRYVEELKESTAVKASIESELNVAHNIQMSMLPKTFPPFPLRDDIELFAILNPAKAVGGDLYDFFLHDEKLFFCIGDVSGKGVPASLVMAVTRTLFRRATSEDSPRHIVETMNTAICEGNDNSMFVTLFVGVLDLTTGHLCYCNAGHDCPLMIGQEQLPAAKADLPVGVLAEWNFVEHAVNMAPGTTIFLFTDGLTEAENAQHEQFGEERVGSIISSASGEPQQLIESMVSAVRQFVGVTEQSDDLTMLAIRYSPPKQKKLH